MDIQQLQDYFIQKKLLYNFDKTIQQLFQSFILHQEQKYNPSNEKMIDQNQQKNQPVKKLTQQKLLQEIQKLQFQNFKYRTALLSAKKDQTSNEQILQQSQAQINQTKKQVKQLALQLQLALKARKNKQDYNQLACSLRNHEPKSVQNAKIQQIQQQIQQLEAKYNKQMNQYQKKQKCLKLALSALKGIIQWNQQQEIQNQTFTSKLSKHNVNNNNKEQERQGGEIFY